jgi:dTDP-4-amino-4,6-dideoxygalactose transaminase
MEEAEQITKCRLQIWDSYHKALELLEREVMLRRPIIPEHCGHNAHMYYVLLAPEIDRRKVLDEFKRNNIGSVSHYVPLHSSPAGKRYGRTHGSLAVTIDQSERLIRLPLWVGLTEQQQGRIADVLKTVDNLLR